MEPKALAMHIAQVLDNKKATRVKVLRVHDLTVLADYFVIASGTSSTHVKSLAEEAEFQLKEAGIAPVLYQKLVHPRLRQRDCACVQPGGEGFLRPGAPVGRRRRRDAGIYARIMAFWASAARP